MITEFKDIEYTVKMIIGKSNNYYVDFEVFKILYIKDSPFYWEKDATSSFPGTTDIENAEYLVKGIIKWDACAQFDFNNSVHLCGPIDAKNLGILISRLFDMAYEMMQTADKGMFEK